PAALLPQTIVSKKHVRRAFDREIKVGAPVVIKITGRHALHVADESDAGFRGALSKGPIAIVAVEFARMAFPVEGFVSDKQVQPAVIIVIEPDAGLRGMEAEQPRLLRNIVECAVAIVAQE